MSKKSMDINDDEIRVISPSGSQKSEKKKKIFIITMVVSVIAIVISAIICYVSLDKVSEKDEVIPDVLESVINDVVSVDSVDTDKGYVEVRDVIVRGKGLTFLIPHNATPILTIGEEALSDTTLVLVAQAADIRADNGKIVGSFVLKGDLISKGEAKSGFCAIVNDNISIGVADATPMLEQAIANDGYFFRQFPLVVGGQLVENNLKTSSFRKALVDINGDIGIVMSSDKMTLHEFSEVLVEAGVRNAIYLVGGTSPGRYLDISGNQKKFGKDDSVISKFTSFIVWK